MPDTPRYLRREELDAVRWDECVASHANGLVYAQSMYLDAMTPGWQALVFGDYESVLPIPLRKKFGIRYAFTPPFVQQLGLIGLPAPPQSVATALHQQVRYGTLPLNFSNVAFADSCNLKPLANRIIDLANPYAQLSAGYAPGCRTSIANAKAAALAYSSTDNIRDVISAYQIEYGPRMPGVSPVDFARFEELCTRYQANESIFIRNICSEDRKVLASALLIADAKRLYFLINTVSAEGRRTEANYLLLDGIIAEFAGRPLLLDLEGSDLPGVAAFYARFGGVCQPYFHYHFNRLPFPLSLLR